MEEMQGEFTTKKMQGLKEIKDKFNELSSKVKIDAMAVIEALKKNTLLKVTNLQIYKNFIQDKQNVLGAVESPIKGVKTEEDLTFENGHNEYGLNTFKHRESTGYIGQLR